MKRIRTFLILTLFLVSMTGSAFAAGANTEQQTAASYLREAGIMVGNETGDMMLDQGLTRAQMAAVLTRIVANPDHVEADSAYYRGQCKFTDVPDWAKVYVGYCAANHLVAGYGNGLYGPSDPVTPAAACTVMLRCLGDVDMEWTYSTACQTAVELGLSSAEALTGAEITRGNMAVLIYRTMAKMGYDIEVSEAPQSATPAGQAIFYASVVEVDKYGNIQNYMVDTDPTRKMNLSAYSNYGDEPEVEMDTGLQIVKYEAGTTIPLSGAMFEVVGPDGATVGTFTTNSSGKIRIPLTLTGNYTVYERVAPDFYLLSEEPAQNVQVVYGEVAEVVFENEPYGNLRIEKTSNTGMNLPGALITITHIESGQRYTGETNSAGVAVFREIQPGAYRIEETAAPAGWLLDDTIYTTTVIAGETTTFHLVNEELPGLRIIKYDRKNMVAMPDVTFEVWRDGVSLGTFRTDEFGEILLTDVEPGTYRAVEVDTGSDGHILNTTPQEVELEAGDGIKELMFFNDVKPGLRLVKVDSADPSKVIPNVLFEIKSVAGDYGPEEFRTDENGEIVLSKLPAGAYVVTELSCPGYVIDEAQRIIQLDPNEDAQFVFTNSIKPSLQIIKLSSDGSTLEGVTFRIAKIEDGTHYLDRTTNKNGEILVSDLEPGVYSVRETSTVSDHIIDLREYKVELFPGKTSTLVIENQIRPNLYVYKHDADTGEPIPDTVFIVRAADGHSVDEIRTGTDGRTELKNLLPGVYEISEKYVPSPYLLDAPSQLVTLYPNRDHTVYFENHQKPSLTVNKICSVTGEPLKGAKFHVTYASNDTESGEINDLGYFYSDADGQFKLSNLKDGWYKITEVESVPGYRIKDPAAQEVFVKAGESKTVTFENTPLSALVVFKFDSVTGEAVKNAVPHPV